MVAAFRDVVGHQQVLALLGEEVARPTQAYLFIGPSSVGKATVARRFASLLLCSADDEDCRRRVIGGTHPDLVLVEPDGRTSLTVDQARATVAQAVLAPIEADRKVFLFEEAGMMNDEAANALLKTLEEPTASTIFILVAEAEDELPATVASRARTVYFGRVPQSEVVSALVDLGVEPERAEDAARTSGGRPGLALMLATRPEVGEFRRVWLGVPEALSARPGDAFRLAKTVMAASDPLLVALRERQRAEVDLSADDGEPLRAMRDRHERGLKRATSALFVTGLEILASWYRDVAAAQFGAPVRNRDIPATALTAVTPAAAVAKAERVLETVDALAANQRPELAFAALFADLAAET